MADTAPTSSTPSLHPAAPGENARFGVPSLQSLFQTMPLGVVYQDADGSITAANPAAERLLGRTLDEMRGRTSADPHWRAVREDGTALPADEHPSMVALRTGRPVHGSIMGVFNPSWEGTRWLRVSATPEFRHGGTVPFQIYAVFEDVTEWHAERTAKEHSEELRRAALAGAPIVLWATDAQGVITLAEGSGLARVGQTGRDYIGISVLDPSQDPSLRTAWRRAMAGQTTSYDTNRQGVVFHNELTPQRDVNGVVTGVIGVALDVTLQRQSDTDLRESHGRLEESEKRLRLALESGRLGSWELDLESGEFRGVSSTFKALFGLEADARLVRAENLRLIHPDDLPLVQAFIDTAVRTRETAVFEFRVRWQDGSEHWLQGHGLAVYDAEGRAVRIIGATHEITERKRAEASLRRSARQQAVLVAAQQKVARTADDLDAALEVVVRSAQELTGADGAVVEMVEGEEMVYRVASGSASTHVGLRLRREGSLSGRCVVEGRPLLCEDSEDDPRVDREACRRVGVRSMAVVPLQYLGKAVGVLKVYSAAPRAFGEDTPPLLALMASIVVAAMSGASEAEA